MSMQLTIALRVRASSGVWKGTNPKSPARRRRSPEIFGRPPAASRRHGFASKAYRGIVTKTAAATTEVHRPSRSPIADCVTLRVRNNLSDTRQISLRSS